MGVSVRINGFKKEQDYIVGQIVCLGIYEVKLEGIEACRIRNHPIVFRGDILMITALRSAHYLTGPGLNEDDYLFYRMASNHISGQSLRNENGETIGIMFEPEPLLRAITRLLHVKDDVIARYPNAIQKDIRDRNEIEHLIEFKSLLEETLYKDGMVGITIR